jgi:hypothetical protein
MTTALLVLVVTLFCLKIGWNLGLPYALAFSPPSRGISLMPGIEGGLFVLAWALSCSPGGTFLHDPTRVGLWGIGMILGSYAHLSVGGAVVALVRWSAKRCRSR